MTLLQSHKDVTHNLQQQHEEQMRCVQEDCNRRLQELNRMVESARSQRKAALNLYREARQTLLQRVIDRESLLKLPSLRTKTTEVCSVCGQVCTIWSTYVDGTVVCMAHRKEEMAVA